MASSDAHKCGKCGYELTGLGYAGRCPECGTVFNIKTGKGIASSHESMYMADHLLRRVRTIFLGASAVVMLICGAALQLVFPGTRWLGVLGFFAVLALLGAVTSFVYEKD